MWKRKNEKRQNWEILEQTTMILAGLKKQDVDMDADVEAACWRLKTKKVKFVINNISHWMLQKCQKNKDVDADADVNMRNLRLFTFPTF